MANLYTAGFSTKRYATTQNYQVEILDLPDTDYCVVCGSQENVAGGHCDSCFDAAMDEERRQ